MKRYEFCNAKPVNWRSEELWKGEIKLYNKRRQINLII